MEMSFRVRYAGLISNIVGMQFTAIKIAIDLTNLGTQLLPKHLLFHRP